MDATLDIVELIEKNPITKLSHTYNGKLLTKIKETFTDFEQKLFIGSFYCYLNHDPKKDFIIDLDNVWKWMGFTAKGSAKRLLEQSFILDTDYKMMLYSEVEQDLQNKSHGGHNKQIFSLNVKTFKSMCLKAGTKKADEIHDYYLKMEELIHQVVQEESDELKQQLDQAKYQLEQNITQNDKEKQRLVEETILLQFPLNTQCIYYGHIDNWSLGQAPRLHNEQLIKFGQSNNLSERIIAHKKSFANFRLVAAFKVKNKIEIENCIKKHPVLQKRIRSLMINDLNHRELLAIDDGNFTIDKMDGYIREIIRDNEYNIENYKLMVEKNGELEDEIRRLENKLTEKDNQMEKMNKELTNYKSDISSDVKNKITSHYSICKYGYFLYAFECQPMRYKCSIIRQKDYDMLVSNLTNLDANGAMRHTVKVSYPMTEKIMTFLMKQSFSSIGNMIYEGSLDDIKKVLDISCEFEKLLESKGKSLDELLSFLQNIPTETNATNDPETPTVRKAKRSIDQINIDTGEVVATYESIEAAGRMIGLTTGTAIGIALREKRHCRGFLWRYSGISKEDQYSDQPVVKINCKTGVHTPFNTIADAARDGGVSAPALRQRILTNVHINGHHWVFDKNSSHYK